MIEDVTAADEAILDALHHGALTTGAIVDETNLDRDAVEARLDALEVGNAVEAVHEPTALYRLRRDPRGAASEATYYHRVEFAGEFDPGEFKAWLHSHLGADDDHVQITDITSWR